LLQDKPVSIGNKKLIHDSKCGDTTDGKIKVCCPSPEPTTTMATTTMIVESTTTVATTTSEVTTSTTLATTTTNTDPENLKPSSQKNFEPSPESTTIESIQDVTPLKIDQEPTDNFKSAENCTISFTESSKSENSTEKSSKVLDTTSSKPFKTGQKLIFRYLVDLNLYSLNQV
jgi:hypothetical protein